ncbi:MAG: hypothetical protein K2W94_02095 [Alphaproteobacteria bacterium]|nr:hypothetical protein [Alphaproteobacteria bacterium]
MINTVFQALHSTVDYVRHAFSSLPLVIIILLIIAFVVMLITIILTIFSMRRSSPKVPKPPSAAAADKEKKRRENGEDNNRLPPLGGWISEFLSKKGFFHVSTLSLSFLRALDFLRDSLHTYNYKYYLPWYLLIGAEGSGKTSLIEGAELNMPLGHPDLGIHNPNPECRWWFLNRGVILDIKGNLFLNKKEVSCEEKGWRSLLVLLSRYRSARPINGIILAIPANEIYGKHKLTKDEISSRADFLSHKLAAAQNNLGLRLPVYIVVTKLDTVPGFQSFCSEIPTSNRHNILGWSSPYTLSTAYTSKWVDEAFNTLEENLNQLRLEIFAEGRVTDSRDGVFVFPSEILNIKDNLSVYVNHIFKNDAYQESLLLRGIYFCGDSGMTPLRVLNENEDQPEESHENLAVIGNPDSAFEQDAEHPSLASQLTPESLEPIRRKIFFIDDLITDKILREPGLSVPLQKRLLSINKALNLAKIFTAVFILFGSYGLFSAYEKFVQSRDYMMPILSKMNTMLHEMQQINLNEPGQSSEMFDSYARQLLEMMDQMQQTKFFSVFVPASWFSPLHKDLEKTLKVSYQQIIVRTIYIDLLLKARELLHLRPTLHDRSVSIAQLLQPTESAEFQLLKRYIESLATLQEKIDKFNHLKSAADAKDLDDLVSYTFHAQLPQKFIHHYKKFRSLLKNTTFPPIDLRPYQQLARETLNIIYQNFLNAVFTVSDPGSLPARLQTFLQQLSQQQTKHLPDPTYLRQLSLDLAQVVPSLGEVGQTWLDREFFNPSKEFDHLLDKVDSSKLFGKEITQFLVDQTAIGFNNLKLQLQAINQLLVHQPNMPVGPLAQKAAAVQPSQGIISMQKSLLALFSEPYMAIPSTHSFTNQVPIGKIIYWDSKMIQMAYDMCKRFEDFTAKQVSGFPPILQENIKLFARESLQANVINLLAQAQSFVDAPSNLSEGVAAEEILRSKINDVKESAPKFVKLLEVLNQDSVGVSFVELRTLLSSTSFWLLSQVEHMLHSLTPYSVHDLSFSWWEGKQGAAFVGYSSKDAEDLKVYLSLQRQLMQTMAMDFAKPLVTFLTSDIMLDAAGDKVLLNKWHRIVDQMESFVKKQPGNSVTALEDFILKTLNSYDIRNCFDRIPLEDIRHESGDYFVETIRSLKKGILARGEVLKRKKGIENYNKLVAFYNHNLKNKFPFVASNVSLSTPEVDPESIRDFFRMFDEAGGSAKAIFDQIYQLSSDVLPALRFLQNMENVKTFFQNYLSGNGDNDLPTFTFNIDFRVNRQMETGGDLIVDWTIKPHPDVTIDKNDKSHVGRWSYGNPIEIGFRWPDGDGIPAKPAKDPLQPVLDVDGRKAIIKYTGRWALLWMLKMHGATKGDYTSLKDPNPFMLKFVIPTGAEDKAIVYNLITIMAPSSNPKAPGKVIPVPAFPVLAPELDPAVTHYGDQAVLTEGVVTPLEYMEAPASPPPGPEQILPPAPLPEGPSPAAAPDAAPAAAAPQAPPAPDAAAATAAPQQPTAPAAPPAADAPKPA